MTAVKRPASALLQYCIDEGLLTQEEVETVWTAAERHLDEAELRWGASLDILDGDDAPLPLVAHVAIFALALGNRARRKIEFLANLGTSPWQSLARQIEAGPAPPNAMAL